MTQPTPAAVILEDVQLQLGTQTFRFDCRIPDRKITAVTGPSGSGKSTLLNLVAGFETPQAGRVIVSGQDVGRLHPSARPVSLVFQDNNLFSHLDLFTNVGLGIDPALRLDAAGRQAVSAALARVGLGGFERRLPPTLSGGERQRAAFARALVRHRPLLLLDEPFAALDHDLRDTMVALLLDLHQETQNTVLIVSHDPAEVRDLADHVLVIAKGHVVASLDTSEFFEQYP